MAAKKTILVLSLIVLITSICGTAKTFTPNQQTGAVSGSTSQYVMSTDVYKTQQEEQDSNVITFSEFPLGTYITNQYSNRGIIFGGDSPFITTDGSNPTSPVLSGTPQFQGTIEGRFVNPNNGITPITISSFSLDAGYFDDVNTTRIEWFDQYDNKLGERINSALGIEHFNIEGSNIARWRIATISSEPGGFAIDNVSINNFNNFALELSKKDNVNNGDCVGPGRQITYTIDYNYPAGLDINNVNIMDYLPFVIDFNSASNGGVYNSGSRTVIWNVGTLHSGNKGSVTLKVNVEPSVEPGITFANYCEIKSGEQLLNSAYEYTSICWRIIYTDTDANGANNGTSWQNAYNCLQDALRTANRSSGYKEIWIAGGTYKPDCSITIPNGSGDRTAVFRLINGVKIKGGYAGYGAPDPNFRDTNWYKTILSGDIGIPDVNADNSYHVVTADSIDETTILDGLTITAGNANGSSPYDAGGGMYNHNASPVVINCIFTKNVADANGGGMYNESSNPKITNCIFSGNLADYGGGISDSNSSPTVTNCTFIKNTANANGGGIYNNGSSPTIINCILWGNTASKNPQVYNYNNSSPIITYSDMPWDPDADPNLQFNLNFENNNDPCTKAIVPTIIDARGYLIGKHSSGTEANSANSNIYELNAYSPGLGTDANFMPCHDGSTSTSNDIKVRIPYDSAGNLSGNAMFDMSGGTLGSFPVRTWAFWIWPAAKDSNPNLLSPDGTVLRLARSAANFGDPNYFWEIGLNNCQVQFTQKSGPAASAVLLTAQTTQTLDAMGITSRQWHHIAVVINRNTQTGSKIFVDGLQRDVTVIDYRTQTAVPIAYYWDSQRELYIYNPLIVGSGSKKFNGLLDEIRLYNKSLAPYQDSILSGHHNINADPCFVGHHNIDADPCFVNPAEGNYRLRSNSPCIDAGNNNSVPPDYADLDNDGNTTEPTPFDLDGFLRFIDGDCIGSSIVDMGVYEFSHAYLGDFNGDCDVDFQDFAILATAWLTEEGQTDYKPICDISISADRKINMLDLEVLVQNWLWGTGM
jgi:hypothetical protein